MLWTILWRLLSSPSRVATDAAKWAEAFRTSPPARTNPTGHHRPVGLRCFVYHRCFFLSEVFSHRFQYLN